MKSENLQQKKVSKRDWEPISNPNNTSFTADELIDAYFRGLDRGMNDFSIFVKKQIEKNIEIVKLMGEEFFNDINKASKTCYSIFMKLESVTSFKMIYVLEKETYSDDTRSKPIYKKSWDLKDKIKKNNDIEIKISFIPKSDHLNTSRLISDGYFCFYGELH